MIGVYFSILKRDDQGDFLVSMWSDYALGELLTCLSGDQRKS